MTTESAPLPRWLVTWWCGNDTGASSKTIAAVLSGERAVFQLPFLSAPSDAGDVGRCVRLLDLAEKNGQDWRTRLPEVGAVCRGWAPLVARWADVEAAYRRDIRTRCRPETTYQIIRGLGGGR